jgi:hypothetical protein
VKKSYLEMVACPINLGCSFLAAELGKLLKRNFGLLRSGTMIAAGPVEDLLGVGKAGLRAEPTHLFIDLFRG